MKRIASIVGAVASVGLLATWLVWTLDVSEIPSIPESMVPANGSVVEYWPNEEVRSERVYRDGKVQEAVYYSSSGSVVFEMSNDGA